MSNTNVNARETFRLTVFLDAGTIEGGQEALDEAGFSDYVLWQLEDSQDGTLSFYRETREDLQLLRQSVESVLKSAGIGDGCGMAEEVIRADEWENSWKKYFHAQRLSDRIVVRPSWEQWQGRDSDIEVVIDPGMSFGTGLHPTTRACIKFIDKLSVSGGSMLDAGCGSGILAIAGAKLGYQPVMAFDNDPVAVECARKNIAVNGVAGLIDLRCMPLEECCSAGVFDAVVVNILAHVIESHAGLIVSLLKPVTGRLVLAGILNKQFDGIAGCFAGYGLKLAERVDEGEWSSGLFDREV